MLVSMTYRISFSGFTPFWDLNDPILGLVWPIQFSCHSGHQKILFLHDYGLVHPSGWLVILIAFLSDYYTLLQLYGPCSNNMILYIFAAFLSGFSYFVSRCIGMYRTPKPLQQFCSCVLLMYSRVPKISIFTTYHFTSQRPLNWPCFPICILLSLLLSVHSKIIYALSWWQIAFYFVRSF